MTPVGAALQLRGVSKSFAGRRVLSDVSLTLRPGRVTALLGANGSGKSTLIKILAGYHPPEHGAEISVRGRPLHHGSPAASHAAGLRFIHQELGLIDSLDVAENLRISRVEHGLRWISNRRERRDVRLLLQRYRLDLDPRQPVGSLRASERTMIAIIRAVEDGLGSDGVLVLDEPTASLPPDEVEQLMDLLTGLKADGVAILYVSHRLPEVAAIADDVCVLRDGKVVASRSISGLDTDTLVELILGRPLEDPQEHRSGTVHRDALLALDGISGSTVAHVSLTVGSGEIVGVTGVIGSGYESLLGLAFGATSRTGGSVRVAGHAVAPRPDAATAAGLAYVPPERRLSIIPEWTVRENLTLPAIRATGPAGWLTARRERADASAWVRRLAVTPPDPEARFMSLSGGNQQKVIIARWLRRDARAFLVDEPTLGVDAGAKRAIHDELRVAAAGGAAVLISSSDLDELCEVCDRVLVTGNGRVVTSLQTPLDPDRLFAETMRAANRTAHA